MPMFIRTTFLLCTMLVFTAQALAADISSYVVLPFKVTGASGFTYLEKAIPSMLNSRLYWKDHFQPVSDAKAAEADRIGRSGEAAGVAKAQNAAGADYAVWGNVTVVGDEASLDVRVRDKAGKEWRKGNKTKVNDLISALQGVADSINADLFGRPTTSSGNAPKATNMVNQMNPAFTHNETTQQQVYLNPQFRYQGNDGTRYRSQTLPYAAAGMVVADVNGDGKNEVVVLGEKRLFVYQWDKERLIQLGEFKLPTDLSPIALRSIDLNRDRVEELVLTAYEEEHTEPYSFVLSFKGNKFTEIAARVPYYLNVVRLAPDYMPVLIGQKGDSSRIFARAGVYEMMKQGDTFVPSKKVELPKGANVLNFAWLPGKNGEETAKLVMVTDEEHLRTFSPQGSQLNQSDEKYSGSAIGIEEQTQMPGMGKDNILIPSKYFTPLRMIPADLEQDGSWELLVNKPISVSAQFFENYRFFPEGEIHSLFWDGVGMSLQWKTRRIKGSVVDFALSDPNNNGVQDLVVCLNTHPGALGLQNRKTVIVAYPLDLTQMDPKTAPALE
ncbi:MAG: VCBS repeat-containing protein [Bilophila sp.]